MKNWKLWPNISALQTRSFFPSTWQLLTYNIQIIVIWVCMYIFIYRCQHGWGRCVCRYVWGCQSPTSDVLALQLVILDKVSGWPRSSPILDCLASELQGSICLHSGLTLQMCVATVSFLVSRLLRLESGLSTDVMYSMLAHVHWATHPSPASQRFQCKVWVFKFRSSCCISPAVLLFQVPTHPEFPRERLE